MALQIKRIYDPAEKSDGIRLLVDRIWPRGVSKERAQLDGWEKELAPSTELREWFDHKAERFDAFTKKYRAELAQNPDIQPILAHIREESQNGTVTLLYGAKDPAVNHAVVLKGVIEGV